MTGLEIKTLIVKAGLKNYVVAEKFGIAETSFSRKLRGDFSDDDTEKVLSIIEELKKEAGADIRSEGDILITRLQSLPGMLQPLTGSDRDEAIDIINDTIKYVRMKK